MGSKVLILSNLSICVGPHIIDRYRIRSESVSLTMELLDAIITTTFTTTPLASGFLHCEWWSLVTDRGTIEAFPYKANRRWVRRRKCVMPRGVRLASRDLVLWS